MFLTWKTMGELLLYVLVFALSDFVWKACVPDLRLD